MAEQKNKYIFDFYENIKNGYEILSVEDLELAIESLKFAQHNIKEREYERIKKKEKEKQKAKSNIKKDKKVLDKSVLYVPKGTIVIKNDAFKGNTEIKKVVLNEELSEIGERAFSRCINLEEIVFPDKRIILRRECFANCIALKSIIIPKVSNICPGAFKNCFSLESVTLPQSVSNIYSEAFKNCYELKKFEFKNGGEFCYGRSFPRAFENCVSLEKIYEPQRFRFNKKSFINCSSLKEIYIYDGWLQRKFVDCKAEVKSICSTKNGT